MDHQGKIYQHLSANHSVSCEEDPTDFQLETDRPQTQTAEVRVKNVVKCGQFDNASDVCAEDQKPKISSKEFKPLKQVKQESPLQQIGQRPPKKRRRSESASKLDDKDIKAFGLLKNIKDETFADDDRKPFELNERKKIKCETKSEVKSEIIFKVTPKVIRELKPEVEEGARKEMKPEVKPESKKKFKWEAQTEDKKKMKTEFRSQIKKEEDMKLFKPDTKPDIKIKQEVKSEEDLKSQYRDEPKIENKPESDDPQCDKITQQINNSEPPVLRHCNLIVDANLPPKTADKVSSETLADIGSRSSLEEEDNQPVSESSTIVQQGTSTADAIINASISEMEQFCETIGEPLPGHELNKRSVLREK